MKIGILSDVPHGWDVPWQVKHPVLTRLAERAEVVWMAPPVSRTRVLTRWGVPTVYRPQPERPTLTVYHPEPWLPRLHRPSAVAGWLARQRLQRGRALLRRRGCDTFVLYLWRPEPSLVENSDGFDLRIYHIDDEYTFSSRDVPVPPAERMVLEQVDQVIIHSQTLYEKKGAVNPNTVQIPNGVDYRGYATPASEPSDLSGIARPRVGYSGFLKRQLDWALLESLAARMSDLQFVFIGPVSPHPEVPAAIRRLSDLENVHFLGGKPTGSLPAYVQHFDVCAMPYRIDGYTRYIYPLKLHEYLATGRPVVATPIPALQPFGDVLTLAATVDEWQLGIRAALAPAADTARERERRQAVAAAYDWDALVDRIWDLIRDRIGSLQAAS